MWVNYLVALFKKWFRFLKRSEAWESWEKTKNEKESKKRIWNFYESWNKYKFQRYVLGCYFMLGNVRDNFKNELSHQMKIYWSKLYFYLDVKKAKRLCLVLNKKPIIGTKMDNFKQIDPSEIYFVENYWTFKPIAEQISFILGIIIFNHCTSNYKLCFLPFFCEYGLYE